MVYAASLALERSAFKSCAKDEETVSELYVSEIKITSVLALKTLAVIKRHKTTYLYL